MMSLRLSRRQTLAYTGAGLLAAGSGLRPSRALSAPRKGGVLKVALGFGATSDSLDPSIVSNDMMLAVNYSVYNYLTEIGPDGSLLPELAESWEAASGAKTWTFRLRRGVSFHDGKSFGADDVLATIAYHKRPDSTSGVKSLVDQIVDMRKDDEHTVVIELDGGNADFPYLTSAFHLAMKASRDGAIDPFDGIGTGPFRLESFEPGIRVGLTRNPDYWKEGRGHFDGIELVTVMDPSARANALAAGEVHVNYNPDRKSVELAARNPAIRVVSVTGNQHFTIPMLVTVPPFDNYHVRNALKWSIDREKLVDTILQGYGKVGNDNPVGFANRYRATEEELPQRVYDPERAKFHLSQAGLSSLKVPIHPSEAAFNGCVDMALLIADSARAAGIEVEVIREPEDGYWDNVWMKKPWSFSHWGGRPTEDWLFTMIYYSKATWNETLWSNARFDELLLAARSELDEALRREMYVEMQQILHDEGGQVVPVFADWMFACSTNVQYDPVISSSANMDGMRFSERWWFEDA